MPTKQRPYRILSIDGGGFRGVIPAKIIMEFERISGKPMKDMFDVFIGTSTGAILATSLVAPTTPGQQTNRFNLAQTLISYKENGPKIFKKKSLHELEDQLSRISTLDALFAGTLGLPAFAATHPKDGAALINVLNRLRKPLHDIDVLLEILQSQLGDLRMGDALKRLMVTAYDLNSRTLQVFDSNHTNRLMYKTAAASASAPTFFAPLHLPLEGGAEIVLTDGGVGLPNPALYAVTKLISENVPLSAIRVVSIGTGQAAGGEYDPKIEKWGPLQWLMSGGIMKVFMDGMLESTNIHLKALLGDRYHRLQVEMDTDTIHLDDGSSIYFESLFGKARDWIIHNNSTLNAAVNAVNL